MSTGYGKLPVRRIGIQLIDPPVDVARDEIGESDLEELVVSIRSQGILQPLLLRIMDERFEVVAGHRRFLAAKRVGLDEVPAFCKVMSDEECLLIRATENLQRKDLTPVEEGKQYWRLMERCRMTIDKISKIVGKSPGVIKRRIDLLRMPETFQRALHQAQINVSVAEELWACPDEGYRDYLLQMAIEHGVTKEVARMWVADRQKELRAKEVQSGGGCEYRSIGEPEPIFRACEACRDPVDLGKMRELRLCRECYMKIMEAIR